MKNTLEFALYGGVATGTLNLVNQFLDPNVQKINLDELWNETKVGLKIGVSAGLFVDILDSLEPQRKLSQRTHRVWEKGEKIIGYDSNVWRRSRHGHIMKYSDYGNRNSEYGWEIEHGRPASKGGTDHINNLNPENWKENLRKGTKYPYRKA